MGIWRVLSGTMRCDTCRKLLAHVEFDAADEPNIERLRIFCVECVGITAGLELPDPSTLNHPSEVDLSNEIVKGSEG